MSWTAEQVLALAPDAASAKAGRDLATVRKWASLARDERALWGECQGSGSKPYQTRIDLAEPAFGCSCPSRKFPCKHALGLFLLSVQRPGDFGGGPPPSWVADWLDTRAKQAEAKARKAEAQARDDGADPAAAKQASERQAKVAAGRQARVEAGLEDLDRWLGDLARRGLAAVRGESYSFWEAPAARMVDAQAPGVARLVRELAGIPASGEGWQGRLLERLGRLHLLLEAHRRLDSLPESNRDDVRALVGWTQSQEELLAGPGVRDRWIVLGQRVEEEDRLRSQRRWLWGEQTGRAALVLHFAHGSQPLDASLVPGTVVDAELAFYAGSFPLRALVKARHATAEPSRDGPGYDTIAAALTAYSGALARNPWIERVPMALTEIQAVRHGGSWAICDTGGARLPLAEAYQRGWDLVALGGGRPIAMAGEFDGDSLLPLGAWSEGRYLPLS